MPQINNKIYWYEKTNGEIFDCDEFSASKVHKRLKFIGWSSGEFIIALGKIPLVKKGDTPGKAPANAKSKIEDVIAKEIEFAKNNTDRTAPRDFSKESIASSEDSDGSKALNALQNRG